MSLIDLVISCCSSFFSCLSTFLALNQTFPPSTCPNVTNSMSCPIDCASQLNTTLYTMGCCFSILNNTAYGDQNITGPYEYEYWTQCGVATPNVCECDYSTASEASTVHSGNISYYLSIISLLYTVTVLVSVGRT